MGAGFIQEHNEHEDEMPELDKGGVGADAGADAGVEAEKLDSEVTAASCALKQKNSYMHLYQLVVRTIPATSFENILAHT
jgi:hypothetical protein